ncbi:CRISPR-associated helicase Cas3' [Peptoniphilus rhinitidis]|uniref:CRISPR-associated helicase Cas3' n=1 Tax=Peptoniphilus rhinitidis TaxID=1175452 RepID=UPI0023526498|nr:CRISPR-associated helicase Cas3' [Peptoniphilus rhinitidis]
MLDKLYAHIDGNKKQDLFSHLVNTACECKAIGEKVHMTNLSFLIGLLHDIGKASNDFQEKITKNSNALVDHSTLGGLFILKIYEDFNRDVENKKFDNWQDLFSILNEDSSLVFELGDYANILIYTIMSHHGQYDMVRKNDKNEFVFTSFDRIKKIENSLYKDKKINNERILNIDEFYEDSQKFFESKNIYIKDLFCKGFCEYAEILKSLKNVSSKFSEGNEALFFYKGMMIRLLVSILKSADIKDTINSYDEIIIKKDEEELKKVIKSFEKNVENKYASFGNPDGKLNIVRNEIAEDILNRSKEDGTGIYKLDLPTGAGKTLLSLRYGINQMNYQNKERFFYVTSFLSVLEQNAKEMKDVLDNDDYILEHHSNIIDEDYDSKTNDDIDDSIKKVRKKYLLDDWTSPVVLTTTVQFYNTIFKGKSSNLTRFKSMINSVIILDEWQSIPTEFLYLTNLALNFMKVVMNVTIVLSTATQPTNASNYLKHKLFYGDLDGKNEDIIDLKNYECSVFERAKLKIFGNIRDMYGIEDIRDLVLENPYKSNLIILNTKSVVRKLYDLLKENYDEKDLYYLTTNLTANDRLKKISEIKKRLKNNEKICVISTQLIEAGVDVDFDLVIRSLTGMDSVIQAMGRCNREGKKEIAYTYLINLDKNEEKSSLLKGVDERKSASQFVLGEVEENFDLKCLTEDYFEKLYANLNEDNFSPILEWLSENPEKIDNLLKTKDENIKNLEDRFLYAQEEKMILNLFQSFKKAYNKFQLIEENQKTAIVNYDETREEIKKIWDLEEKFLESYDVNILKELKVILKKLNRHTVAIREKDVSSCDKILDGEVYILPEIYYDKKFGLDFKSLGGMIL